MISNEKANLLFTLDKNTKEEQYILPNPNDTLSIELFTTNKHFQNEIFTLDINRKYLSLSKKTFQKRVQQSIILRRLDFFSGHKNPMISAIPNTLDNNILSLMKKYENLKFHKETHIHFYIEGYGEKWAFPITEFELFKTDNLREQTKEFCKYCNIIDVPEFNQKDLLCMT